MRSGGYTVQHSLTSEAATIVKQAITVARRRGHAQVTPLHVASAMLTSSAGLLRKACLQSHSHPLQCKALELCFNVALNRLPTSQSSPLLGPHSHYPSLSNALVAAFKRAQAHQRRGSIENQQQPILALKVEIEQLVISILDDPSVSRVMREAGFSSPQVKNNVEQSVSLEICSQSPVVSSCNSKEVTKPLTFGTKIPFSKVPNEDIMSVIDSMMNKKRKNTVVIGECLASAEAVVRGVIDKFENGNYNRFPSDLRFVQFVSLPLYSLNRLSREDVEEKVKELRSLVKSNVESRGVVLYLGDLKWVSDFWSTHGQQRMNYYSPVEHMIMELNRLMFGVGDSGKLWLMGTATFQTYMRCKSGQPSLESLWDLYPLTIPGRSLDLSLNLERDSKDQFRSTIGSNILNNESTTSSTSTSLPSWLQQYKEESKRKTTNEQPHFLEKGIQFSSSPSTSVMSPFNQNSSKLHHSLLNWPVIYEYNRSPKEHQFFASESEGGEVCEPNFKTFIPTTKLDLLSNPNSSPNSVSSSEASDDMEILPRFKEVTSENLESLCKALKKKVPWQSDIVPEIANTILECRSGKMKRKGKEETWLFFLGADNKGKEKIARELAKVVFGSKNSFISMGLSSFSSISTRADSTDQEFSNKRARDEKGQSYLQRFSDLVRENPSRVFFMEDVEQVDFHSQKGIKKAIESGRITLADGESALLKDAIVIFSCESFSSVSRACSPSVRHKHCESKEEDTQDCKEDEFESTEPCTTLDLNISTEEDQSVSDIGISDSVDKQIIFKIQML